MKNLLNLGKALNKADQKQIFGGGDGYQLEKYDPHCAYMPCCNSDSDCSARSDGTDGYELGDIIPGWCVAGYCNV